MYGKSVLKQCNIRGSHVLIKFVNLHFTKLRFHEFIDKKKKKKSESLCTTFLTNSVDLLTKAHYMQPRLCGHTESGAFHHARDTAEQRPLICETHCQSAARGTVD